MFCLFLFAFFDICVCIFLDLCLHFLTYVASYVFAFALNYLFDLCGCVYGAGSTDVFYWTVAFRKTYNLCQNKCKQMMHWERQKKCERMQEQMHKILFLILFYVIAQNKILFSQNKVLCICCCIDWHTYLHMYVHMLRIFSHLFQHFRFVPTQLQTYVIYVKQI